jgi:hypothetical protein
MRRVPGGDPIVVRYEPEGDGSPAEHEGRVDLRQQVLARRPVEVLEEVHEQYEIVSLAKFLRECAAANRAVTVDDACPLGVLSRDHGDIRPVQSHDLGLRVRFGYSDAEEPVTRRDVEDPDGPLPRTSRNVASRGPKKAPLGAIARANSTHTG